MTEPHPPSSYRLRRPGGEIDPGRIFNAPGIVMAIAVFTFLIFFVVVLAPDRAARIIEFAGAVSPRRLLMGPSANNGYLAMISPLIAHMFLHAGLAHLLFNLLWLLAFGSPVARRLGAENALGSSAAFASASLFLTFYLLCGAFGALTYVFLHADEYTLLVGASGGVSGLLGAIVRFAFNKSTLFGPEHANLSPLTSPVVIMWSSVIILMNVAVGAFGGALAGGANIAWEAHIGGYFFGLLAYPLFEKLALSYR